MKRTQRDQQESDLPSELAKPAQRALAAAGYWRLEQLTEISEAQLKQLHGIGPKALDQLRRALRAKGLSFAVEKRGEGSGSDIITLRKMSSSRGPTTRARPGKVIVGATMSLDGFIADRNGSVARLYPDLEALRHTEIRRRFKNRSERPAQW